MANRTHIDLWQHTSDGMLMGSSKGFSPRARWSPSESQRKMLEDSYNNVGAFPNHERRKVLAAQMGIEVRQVQVWFQNRRQKERKLSNQASYGIDGSFLPSAATPMRNCAVCLPGHHRQSPVHATHRLDPPRHAGQPSTDGRRAACKATFVCLLSMRLRAT